MAEKKGKGGHPTHYKAEYAEQAAKLCKLGATDVDVAEFFKVVKKTIYRWQQAHPAFAEAMKVGKDVADDRVERSLYHRAVGYEHEDVHISNYQGVITETPILKHYPPDTTACIFWLKNRRREDWRDQLQHEHAGKDGGPIQTEDVSALTPVERSQRIAAILAAGKPQGD